MTVITRDTSKGQLVTYVFGQDAVAASQTNAQLPAMSAEEGGTTEGYIAPFAGEVVAIASEQTAAASAGSLTIGASFDGTEDADTTMTVTTSTGNRRVIPRGTARFAAGTEIGCEITTNSGWDATTADLNVVIYALLYLEGI